MTAEIDSLVVAPTPAQDHEPFVLVEQAARPAPINAITRRVLI